MSVSPDSSPEPTPGSHPGPNPAEAGAVSTSTVGVLLVSHDGGRWLPSVIDGVRAQAGVADRLGPVVAVDTGSKDDSADLLRAAFGSVVEAPSSTAFPAAVRLGLDRLRETSPDAEWVWLLHDDANPAPDALAALLAAAHDHPAADVLGPKLREWPSLRRLLEVGVTITGTGRRELGLERGEYDQGQHDDVRPVLAVNTAGMLVRRRVLEDLDGFDPQLPMFGNDVDFGWRAAAAGHTTLVVPQAVVFHAEAAHRGIRKTPLTGRHTHYQERRAALYTLLVNAPARALPFQVVRLAFGTLVRMLGFFLVRSPGEALDDLAALVSLYSQPGRIRAARRTRRTTGSTAPEDAVRVRRLLAPTWLPYRHGLDAIGDLLSALTDQASDVAERRRAAAAEHDPSSMAARRPTGDVSDLDDPDGDDGDDEGEFADTGMLARFVTNPVALLLAVFVLAVLVLAGPALGAVSGGGLSPVPDGVGDWWRLHLESRHPLGAGTDVPAPAYLLPLALLGSLVGTTAAVSLLMVLAVPVALWGSWRFLRVVGRLVSPLGAPRWLLLAGATAYSLVPLASGAWADGRLGLVVVTLVLPWLAHAALGFADPGADRRWRAAWRVGLLLALGVAFAPVLWLVALVIAVVVLVAAAGVVRGVLRDRSVWGPPATALGVVPLVLLPWWLPALLTGAGEGLLLDTGRLPGPPVEAMDLLAGRLDGLGAPTWLGLVLLGLAVVALLPRMSRIPVLVCWVVAVVVAALAAVLARVTLQLAVLEVGAGLGVLVIVLQAALVTAAVLGGLGLVRARQGVRRGARRWLVALIALPAALVPLGGLVWFGVSGSGELAGAEDQDVPAYMVQRAQTAPERGVLIVRGSIGNGLTYRVLRGDGVTLGEDEILALAPEDRSLTVAVRDLVSRPSPQVVARLAAAGVQYVVLPAPADGAVAAGLDATGGLAQASAEDRRTRAWELTREPDPAALDGPGQEWRVLLLLVQGGAILTVAVLCAPTVRRRQR